MKDINWETRDDGVICLTPEGFNGICYVYPANLIPGDKDAGLNIIHNDRVIASSSFATVEEAKAFTINHIKDLIK